jgi:hypothetical protein
MPVAYLDVPSGLRVDIKKKLVKEVAEFIHEAYIIPDTRVFLREWPAEQTSVDGELARPMRPICNFLVPPGLPGRGETAARQTGQLCDRRRMQSATRGCPAPERQEGHYEVGTRILQRIPTRPSFPRRPHCV